MPKKSVREMSFWERQHYSLQARTFHAILIISIIISVAAVAFGLTLYKEAVKREYRSTTWHMSKSAAMLVNEKGGKGISRRVLEIYDGISEEERGDGTSAEYLSRFSEVEDISYNDLRERLHQLQVENDGMASYIAAIDPETDRMIFILDSDPKETYCPPGYYDVLEHRHIETFMNGAKQSLFDKVIGSGANETAAFVNMKKYGYRCTAGTELFSTDKYKVMVFVDTDMSHIAKASRKFFWNYLILLLLVTLLVAFFGTKHMKKTVADPINELAEAAREYTKNRQNKNSTERHFEKLDIKTGDEIENLALTMKDMERDLTEYVKNLTQVTAEKERINTELSVASNIQEGIIPHIFPAFPERAEFDVYASMHPAKEVGGDFYDFFLIDDEHLALVIADVSGKGIPAALFMMASKILIENVSKTVKDSPAKILEKVNNNICSNNTAEMFVTVWLGILDITTGKIVAANAGHEFPAVRHSDGSFELIKDKHGLVVGGMEGVTYTDYELVLEPGDAIFEYTDGVTEATNADNKLFGTERMLKSLSESGKKKPNEILEEMKTSIDKFADGAPQFDDITMICLEYYGKNN